MSSKDHVEIRRGLALPLSNAIRFERMDVSRVPDVTQIFRRLLKNTWRYRSLTVVASVRGSTNESRRRAPESDRSVEIRINPLEQPRANLKQLEIRDLEERDRRGYA